MFLSFLQTEAREEVERERKVIERREEEVREREQRVNERERNINERETQLRKQQSGGIASHDERALVKLTKPLMYQMYEEKRPQMQLSVDQWSEYIDIARSRE